MVRMAPIASGLQALKCLPGIGKIASVYGGG
jgi:hypothetical protein